MGILQYSWGKNPMSSMKMQKIRHGKTSVPAPSPNPRKVRRCSVCYRGTVEGNYLQLQKERSSWTKVEMTQLWVCLVVKVK